MVVHILALVLMSLAAFAGILVLRAGRVEARLPNDTASQLGLLGLGGAVGLAIVGNVLWALGMLGLFTPAAMIAFTGILGVAVVAGAFVWRQPPRVVAVLAWADRALLAVAALGALLLLWVAGIPEMEIDDVTYHQTVQRACLNAGGFFFTPFEPHAAIHQLNNMPYAWALGIHPHSVITPKLIEAWRCILAACCAAGFVAHFYRMRAALLVLAIVPLCTSFLRYGTTSHVDAGMALWFTGAAWMLAWWLRGDGGLRALALGAALAGCLVASKQTGAFMAGPLLLAAAVTRLWQRRTETRPPALWKELALGIGLPLLLVAPWLLKNAVLFGSPFYPFLDKAFPPSDEAAVALTFLRRYYPPLELSLARVLPDWGRAHPIISNLRLHNVNGFLFLAPLAALLFLLNRRARKGERDPDDAAKVALLVCYIPIAVAFLQASFWRFFIAVWPLALALAIGEADRLLARKARARFLVPSFYLLCALFFGWSAARFAWRENYGQKRLDRWPRLPSLWTGDEREYYARLHPDAAVVEWLNEQPPEEGWLLLSAVLPNAPLLQGRFYPNVPCIAFEGIATMDHLGWTAEAMEAELRRLRVTRIVTREALDEGEPARLRERALREERRWEDGSGRPVVLYRVVGG